MLHHQVDSVAQHLRGKVLELDYLGSPALSLPICFNLHNCLNSWFQSSHMQSGEDNSTHSMRIK